MRSQLINLMLELQEKQGISYIYVTQQMMKHISDQVLVMHNGEVVERGSTAGLAAARPDPAPDRRPLGKPSPPTPGAKTGNSWQATAGGPHAALVIQVEGKDSAPAATGGQSGAARSKEPRCQTSLLSMRHRYRRRST